MDIGTELRIWSGDGWDVLLEDTLADGIQEKLNGVLEVSVG